ncbi:DUF397 domain-containing protein [Kineosporia rhizophila]|uniref:DUF397 domain-containing protein n=1 Tax=Kineosporia rhizophila TaxID=84633 RepID=UPI001E491819|nr:DUF397 domain-containing protein [Kineosporia rhizophila]MCE0535242.1 DUF397 domain-containing protein [Kineosporia rhizophila]
MVSETPWIKASASNPNGACVQMRRQAGCPEVRDSKHPEGPALRLSPGCAAAWLQGARNGEFDHLGSALRS